MLPDLDCANIDQRMNLEGCLSHDFETQLVALKHKYCLCNGMTKDRWESTSSVLPEDCEIPSTVGLQKVG